MRSRRHTIARTAFAPLETPAGVATALLGGPIFIGFLTTRPLWSHL